jgi:glycosyltransferase involved in cell wall biosynthesis
MEKKHKYTVIIVNFNTLDFVRLSLYALQKLSSEPHRILLCDNGSDGSEIRALQELGNLYSNLDLIYRNQSCAGSVGHAEALDLLVSYVETDYFMVLDADAVILLRDWDRILLGMLNSQTKVVGTQGKEGKFQDFPLIYAAMFETAAFRQAGGSFMPMGHMEVVGKKFRLDTGEQLRALYANRNYQSIVLPSEQTGRENGLIFKGIPSYEFFLTRSNKTLFAAHYGGGSLKNTAKVIAWWKHIPYLGRLIAKRRNRLWKRKWIRKAYDHLQKQINNCAV